MAKKYVNISGRNFNYERQPDGTYNFKDDAARSDLNSVKADYAKVNLVEDVNLAKVGNQYSTNASNGGVFETVNGVNRYRLVNANPNTVNNGWIFNRTVNASGTYYVAFEYETNTTIVKIETRLDGVFDSVTLSTIADGKRHNASIKKTVTSTLQLYQILLTGAADKTLNIYNIRIMSEDDYKKGFDGSKNFFLQNNRTFITPEMVGCVGDEYQLDTAKMQVALDDIRERGIKLIGQPGKIYCIDAQLDYTEAGKSSIDFQGAALKSVATLPFQLLFDNTNDTNAGDNHHNTIKDIVFDCNLKGGAIDFLFVNKVDLHEFKIRNCNGIGLNIQDGGGLDVFHGWITGDAVTGSVGINMLTSDCMFANLVIKDMKKGIYNKGSNKYFKVHPWMSKGMAGSVCFEHFSGDAEMWGCTFDTYEISIFHKTADPMTLTSCKYYHNGELYDSDTKPIVHYFNTGIAAYAKNINPISMKYGFWIGNGPKSATITSADITNSPNAQITYAGTTKFSSTAKTGYGNIDGSDTISTLNIAPTAANVEEPASVKKSIKYQGGRCHFDIKLKMLAGHNAGSLITVGFVGGTGTTGFRPKQDETFPLSFTVTEDGSDVYTGKIYFYANGDVKVRYPTYIGDVTAQTLMYFYAKGSYEPYYSAET